MRWLALLALAACHSTPHLEWVEAPAQGDVDILVKEQLAHSAGHHVLVYVGAKWCEPCRHLHEAALSGALAHEFSDVRFFAFDLDRDRDRLIAAGYRSALIPLLVVPEANGRAGLARMSGSIKGDGAVPQITPRLKALLGR